ncbi:MAG: UPF0280 family protein [Desulfohalobiaceae bacterium]
MYEPRFYRDFSPQKRWQSYRVRLESSDLYIRSQDNQAMLVQQLLRDLRGKIQAHIQRQPEFLSSLEPVQELSRVEPIIARMYQAARIAGTGPMAAVAGAISQAVALELAEYSPEVIVENGGDNYLFLQQPAVNTIYAGQSRLSGQIGIQIQPGQTPLAVCTSSGTVGHSQSLGLADAATVLSQDACLADATATAVANQVQVPGDLEHALQFVLGLPGVLGAVLIQGETLAAAGDLELCKT